ncbi:hypothetical protein KIN20_018923 [Parelaphostrongylus tenuis]|uniref:Uncharacterized protein n=1 Tax=Parelaphostrongylus tenuis TaxID=148309 RepID=A0AAD5QPX8_PARTN|nr:hypothetical protein KIN20_018923 [Parelaphostrongylus tenuis]
MEDGQQTDWVMTAYIVKISFHEQQHGPDGFIIECELGILAGIPKPECFVRLSLLIACARWVKGFTRYEQLRPPLVIRSQVVRFFPHFALGQKAFHCEKGYEEIPLLAFERDAQRRIMLTLTTGGANGQPAKSIPIKTCRKAFSED